MEVLVNVNFGYNRMTRNNMKNGTKLCKQKMVCVVETPSNDDLRCLTSVEYLQENDLWNTNPNGPLGSLYGVLSL
jgi:hypothetical protein